MPGKNRSGFTLVEVLTVIAIIALLAALVLGLANMAHKKAARSRAESEITQLTDFLTARQTQFGQVPQTRAEFLAVLEQTHHPLAAFRIRGEIPTNTRPVRARPSISGPRRGPRTGEASSETPSNPGGLQAQKSWKALKMALSRRFSAGLEPEPRASAWERRGLNPRNTSEGADRCASRLRLRAGSRGRTRRCRSPA